MIEGARYWLSNNTPGSRFIVMTVGEVYKDENNGFPGIVVDIENRNIYTDAGQVQRDWDSNLFTEIPKPEFPKGKRKVRVAQALMRRPSGDYYTPSFYYATRKEVETFANEREFELIQWPLTINGVEQWIEIEEEVSE